MHKDRRIVLKSKGEPQMINYDIIRGIATGWRAEFEDVFASELEER